MLFYNGASKLGWLLSILGFLAIVTGLIANLELDFRVTSLWDLLYALAVNRIHVSMGAA